MAKDPLYQTVVTQILSMIESGRYAVGDKLPNERHMAAEFNVSRGVVRQAKRELEAQGRIENLTGQGTFVSSISNTLKAWLPDVDAIELTEARSVFEAEIAALAALIITDDIIEELDSYIKIMSGNARSLLTPYQADEAFHYTIAKATKNDTIMMMMESLWNMRNSPTASNDTSQTAKDTHFNERIDEHISILDALKNRDPVGARQAMQLHCNQVKLQLSQDLAQQARA